MATLSKSTFNKATVGVAFSDTITIILGVCPPIPPGVPEVLISATMTSVDPVLPTGVLPGLDPGKPSLTYVPTATASSSILITINGTFSEAYFDERQWEYRDDTTGNPLHTPITDLQSSMSDGGKFYTISKDNVPTPYNNADYDGQLPNPIDTLIRYKPDFRQTRTITYTYTVITNCGTFVFPVTQVIENNWDIGRDKMKNIIATRMRYNN